MTFAIDFSNLQKSEIRNQKSEIRNQKSEIRNQKINSNQQPAPFKNTHHL